MSQSRNESLADEVLSRIAETFATEARRDADRITVRVHEAVATLTGEVRSWSEMQAAERAALTVPGVGRVDNHLSLLVTTPPVSRETPCRHEPRL